MFVVVGDKARDQVSRNRLSDGVGTNYIKCFLLQVVILHHMLSKAVVKARPTVLWCYKKELGFSRYELSSSAVESSNIMTH